MAWCELLHVVAGVYALGVFLILLGLCTWARPTLVSRARIDGWPVALLGALVALLLWPLMELDYHLLQWRRRRERRGLERWEKQKAEEGGLGHG